MVIHLYQKYHSQNRKTSVMKKTLLFIGISIICSMGIAQGSYNWILQNGGLGNDIGYSIVYADNSIYVGGYFEGTVVFNNDTLTSVGSSDIFILRMNTEGDILWARRCGGIAADNIAGMKADNKGNLYISGSCTMYSDFGPTFLLGFGNIDAFVARIDSSGTFRWALNCGSPSDDYGLRVGINPEGTLISFTGSYQDYGVFGPYSLEWYGYRDFFVAQVDSSGNYRWIFTDGTENSESGYGLDVDSLGNTYVAGYFFSNIWYIGNYVLYNSSSNADCFLLKVSASGNLLWAKSYGGIEEDLPRPLLVTGNSLYIAGYHYSSGNFLGLNLTGTGSRDTYVLKADTSGTGIWAFDGVSTQDDECIDIALTPNKDILASGAFAGQIQFNSTVHTSKGEYDAMTLELDDETGELKGLAIGGGTGYDVFFGVTSSEDYVYTTGYFNDTAEFGDKTVISNGGQDAIITQLGLMVGRNEFPIKQGIGIKIIPNPCQIASLITWDNQYKGVCHGIVLNSAGALVKEFKTENRNSYMFSRNGLAQGVYYIKIYTSEKIIGTGKLVIQ